MSAAEKGVPGASRRSAAGPEKEQLAARGDRLSSARGRSTDSPAARGPRALGPRPRAHPGIVDGDAARAALTARLLGRLAVQLGFRLDTAKVVVDGEAARRTAPRGARGLLADGVIWLRPDGYDPGTASGRALLAHEATHLAQRSVAPGTTRRRTKAEAEAEAAAAAADFAEGRELGAAVVPLAEGIAAADTDALAEALPPPGAAAEAGDRVAQVSRTYAKDIEILRDRLGRPVGEADVSYALVILDQYPLDIASAIARAVGTPCVARLANELTDGQRRRHRRSVLSCYRALPQPVLNDLDERLFAGMDLSGPPEEERAAAVEVLRALTDSTFAGLLKGKQREPILALMQPAAPTAGRAAAARPDPDLPRVLDRGELGDARRRTDVVARVTKLVRDGGADGARAALELLRPGVPGPREEAHRTPAERPLSGPLRDVVRALEDGGTVERLIDALPEDERDESNAYGHVLLEVVRHRPVAANLVRLQSLLTYGLFGSLSGIGKRDAWLAYQIVRRLPPADQDRWRRLDGGKWFRRLEDNIPSERREQYEGIVVETAEGRLADVAGSVADELSDKPARTVWQRVLEDVTRGARQSSAPDAVRRIGTAGNELGPERALKVRRAVVVRLDQLGKLSPVLSALPLAFLRDLDAVQVLRSVVALRDPVHLIRHIHDLISRNFWSQLPFVGGLFSRWSVSSREAFLAFQLARCLPADDREELAATERWAAMTDALTEEMRQSAGVSLFVDREGKEGERLRERLRDNRLWTEDRAAELRTLVRMAVELGLRRFVFDRSRETQAFSSKGERLPALVEAFELYAQPHRTEYAPQTLKGRAPEGLQDAIRLSGGLMWFVIKLMVPVPHGVVFSRKSIGFENVEFRGALVTAEYEPETGQLHVAAKGALDLGPVDLVTPGKVLKCGRMVLSDFEARANYPVEEAGRPTGVQAKLGRAEATDALVTGEDLMLGVARLLATSLDARVGRTGTEEPTAQPPVSPPWLSLALGPAVTRFIEPILRVVRLPFVRSLPRAFSLQGMQMTVGNLTLEGLAYGAGITAERASFDHLLIGGGLNQVALCKARVEVLRQRLDREKPDDDAAPARTALREQLDRARAELARCEEKDKRLQQLRQQFLKSASSVGETERKEAARLEQELAGGLVLDVAKAELKGLSGDVRAASLTLGGVGGEVSGPAFTPDIESTSVFVTDADRVKAFRARSSRAGTEAAGPALTGGIRAATATATDVAVLGEIPGSSELEQQLKGLPPQQRGPLEGLLGRVRSYEELDSRARGVSTPPLTPQETQTLVEERESLRLVFGYRAETVEGRGVGGGFESTGPSFLAGLTGSGTADSVTARGVRAGAVSVKELTVAGVKVASRKRDSYDIEADKISVQGAALGRPDAKAAEIGLSGLRSSVTVLREKPGGAITGIKPVRIDLASATLRGLDFRTSDAWVHSDDTARLDGVFLDAGLLRRAGDPKGGWHAHVVQLHCARAAAPGLVFENNGASTPFRAEVKGGALLDIDVRGMDFAIGAPATAGSPLPDELSVGAIENLDIQLTAGAFGGRLGIASARVQGPPVINGALRVRAATDGTGVKSLSDVDLGGLQFTGEADSGPSRGVVLRKLLVGGASVHRSGDVWTIRTLLIPTVELGRLHWATADGASLVSDGPAVLSGLTATGSVTAPTGGPMRVAVDTLKVTSITADQLAYHQGSLHLELGRTPRHSKLPPGHHPLEIRDISLSGFAWTADRGVTTGTLDVGSVQAEFRGQLARNLLAEATVRVTGLNASFLSNGHVRLRARASVDAEGVWSDPGPTGAEESAHVAESRFTIDGLDTGVVDIGPEGVEFGPGDEPGLRIADLGLDEIHYRSANVLLDSMPGGRGVRLHRIAARLKVELRSPAERAARGRDASPIRRIVLREVGVDTIEADGLKLTLPQLSAGEKPEEQGPVEVWLPPGESMVLRDTRLVLPPEGVVLAPPTAPGGGWSIPELRLRIGGETDPGQSTASRPALLVPDIRARVKGIVQEAQARAFAERIDVRFLSGGGLLLDVLHPSLTGIEAVFRSTPRHRLRTRGIPGQGRPRAAGVGAESVHYESATGRITLTDLGVTGLQYENQESGGSEFQVTVDRATLPGKSRIDTDRARGPVGVTLDELEIQDARFEARFHGPPQKKPAAQHPWTATLATLGPYQEVFDSLQGRIAMRLPALGDLHVDLRVVDGRLRYREIERQFLGGWRHAMNFTLHSTPPHLEFGVGIRGDKGSERFVVASWDLDRDELREAEKSERVRIWRLLNIEGEARQKLDAPEKKDEPPGMPFSLRDIDVELSMRSAKPLPIDLAAASGGFVSGTVTLARDALSGLHLTGHIPGEVKQVAASVAQVAPGEPADTRAKIESTMIRLPGGSAVSTGRIDIYGFRDFEVYLLPGFTPHRVTAHIERAVAKDIVWRTP
ncbi:DUF4157 domain-containing protein [Streptomyces sp. ISL-36]|uniref:eCIS core domain-containing protein n=1 Tax=Streptomyces sp. ISL-36 TaxID=2819182 RepID=UPI001BEBDE4F|nr:DUF4157 domain-containing protein [Streptomyces sp. ISL-36]MBT2442706.1 DUF4157 domain-containing protein [Streptomyces sp. ISL-36]